VERDRLIVHLVARGLMVAFVLAAPAALAQNGAQPTGTPSKAVWVRTPDGLDPDPGATGAWAGHTMQAFYDIDGRIDSLRKRIAAAPDTPAKSQAERALASIVGEEKSQIARHGSLLDWARENLSHRLDLLVEAYPGVAG